MIVNMHEAKTHLSRLTEQAAAGTEIIIAKAGRPIARLVAFVPASEPRRPGAMRGKVRMSPDFDATPAWLIDAFEGKP